MWLLNSFTIELKDFTSQEVPDYAILSHTWGDAEVSFQDMRNASEGMYQTSGYEKIRRCCEQAASDGFDYVWVDTCCIDKSSSSELSEAINSMYRWYSNSRVCYTYLVDVPSNEDPESAGSAFTRSRWFTRGWTLQELLAPSSLTFYGQDWVDIGTKASLQVVISNITGIHISALLSGDIGLFSVGQRMSWASRRQTTRVEDTAYCLMGMFGVNMPLLYGEAEKAFLRLQLEILKSSDDHTIFSWTGERLGAGAGLLAHCPAEFVKCGNTRQSPNNGGVSTYAMTNKGLRIELPLISMTDQYTNNKHSASLATLETRERRKYSSLRIGDRFASQFFMCGVYLAVLDCRFELEEGSLQSSGSLAIFLEKKGEKALGARNRYVRIYPHLIESIEPTKFVTMTSEVYVKEPGHYYSHDKKKSRYNPWYVKKIAMAGSGFTLVDAYPGWCWTGEGEGMQQSLLQGALLGRGALVFRNSAREGFLVVLSVEFPVTYPDVVTFTSTDVDWENGANAIGDLVHAQPYNNDSPETFHDRAHASLPGGFVVFVSMRPGRVAGKCKTIIEITVEQETPQNHAQTIKNIDASRH